MTYYKTLAVKTIKQQKLPTVDCPISYHQQIDDPSSNLYCGAASAQMVLNSMDRDTLLQQAPLYKSLHEKASLDSGFTWHAAPDRIEAILNHFKPNEDPKFKLWCLPTADAISRKICWSIQRYERAAIALVQGGAHWIVVVGFESDKAPTSASDMDYTIESFDIYDPGPAAEWGADPPPHSIDEDDLCGTGASSGKNRGDQFNDASLNDWVLRYMTKVEMGSEWRDGFVAICDEDEPTKELRSIPFADAGELIGKDNLDVIQRRAVQGIEERIAKGRAPWALAYEGTIPGTPILVRREGAQFFPFYYLVPFVYELPFKSGDPVPLVVSVGAYTTGGYLGSIAAPPNSANGRDGSTHFNQAFDRQMIREKFNRQVKTVRGHQVRIQQNEQLLDHLVWFPSVEAISPYYPLYRFDVPTPNGTGNVSVRIDGKEFLDLEPRVPALE